MFRKITIPLDYQPTFLDFGAPENVYVTLRDRWKMEFALNPYLFIRRELPEIPTGDINGNATVQLIVQVKSKILWRAVLSSMNITKLLQY